MVLEKERSGIFLSFSWRARLNKRHHFVWCADSDPKNLVLPFCFGERDRSLRCFSQCRVRWQMKCTGSGRNGVTHRVSKWLSGWEAQFSFLRPRTSLWSTLFSPVETLELDCERPLIQLFHIWVRFFLSMVVLITKSVRNPTFLAPETSMSSQVVEVGTCEALGRRLSELVTTVWDKHGGGSLMVCECPLGVTAATRGVLQPSFKLEAWLNSGVRHSCHPGGSYSKAWIVVGDLQNSSELQIRRFPKMGVPQNGWFVMENPNLKWMITRGTPILGHHQIA